MLQIDAKILAFATLAAILIAACGDEAATPVSAATDKAQMKFVEMDSRSPGKPSAPIVFDYEVLGKAIVGLPVSINVEVRGTRDDLGPVTLSYSINDSSALRFQEGQVQRLDIPELREGRMEQLAVVPQREGRLYVNVSAEIETPGGSMIKSMAIPIQVGSAPEPAGNAGVLIESPDGELLQSLPAQEN